MLDPNNQYTKMQKNEYERDAYLMKIENHSVHNENPDYWNILLGDIVHNKETWAGKKALDFGCGAGRNVLNLIKAADWHSVDGVDISSGNIESTSQLLQQAGIDDKSRLYVNSGINLDELISDTYDFVMSTIVFQHICVYDIRKSLLNEIWRVMKFGGLFSLQMGYGPGHPSTQDYYANYYEADGTNSKMDVRIDDPNQLISDLYSSGFQNITSEIRGSWSDAHNQWIYVKAYK